MIQISKYVNIISSFTFYLSYSTISYVPNRVIFSRKWSDHPLFECVDPNSHVMITVFAEMASNRLVLTSE